MATPKKIALLYASGSLLTTSTKSGVTYVETASSIAQWLAELPELALLTRIEPAFIIGEHDDFGLETIERISAKLAELRDDCDGFVVLVRGERLVETAVGIEFLLQGFGKPIIFTGSRYSPDALSIDEPKQKVSEAGLGLRSNLINAVQIATGKGFPATAIMFGSKVIKPTKAEVDSFSSLNFLRSADGDLLGKVDFGISLFKRKITATNFKHYTGFSQDVINIDSDVLRLGQLSMQQVGTSFPVMMVRLRENEALQADLIDSLKKAFQIVILYNMHYVLPHDGVTILSRMTWETALAKVRWARAQSTDAEQFARLLADEIIGEYLNV